MSKLPKNLLFHPLKGRPSWNQDMLLRDIRIDIGRVISIGKHKRLFKVFDRNYNYTLTIHYDKPTYWTGLASVFGGGASLYTHVEETQFLYIRYKSEQDIDNEIKQVQEKLEKLKKYGYFLKI